MSSRRKGRLVSASMSYSLRAGAALSVATGLPNAGGHMARVSRGRGWSGPPEEWAAAVGAGFGRPPQLRRPRRRVRGALAAAEPVTTQREGSVTRCGGAVRHCAAMDGNRRLPSVTNAGGDARRSSFFAPAAAGAFRCWRPAGWTSGRLGGRLRNPAAVATGPACRATEPRARDTSWRTRSTRRGSRDERWRSTAWRARASSARTVRRRRIRSRPCGRGNALS